MYTHINLEGLVQDYERGVIMSRGILMGSNKSDEEKDFEKLRVATGRWISVIIPVLPCTMHGNIFRISDLVVILNRTSWIN